MPKEASTSVQPTGSPVRADFAASDYTPWSRVRDDVAECLAYWPGDQDEPVVAQIFIAHTTGSGITGSLIESLGKRSPMTYLTTTNYDRLLDAAMGRRWWGAAHRSTPAVHQTLADYLLAWSTDVGVGQDEMYQGSVTEGRPRRDVVNRIEQIASARLPGEFRVEMYDDAEDSDR